ncbi:testis development-related protein [Chanos chanos]|uniref:Testis development-related protein n=1 Tax=Chanos chanos TaxID=29144 RepID=A0A6J2WC82_CHACN|nr:testis development-related protein-like [Chanos chanos]
MSLNNMFKKSKSKMLVDEEEDDISWHHDHARKNEGAKEVEETLSPSTKELKLKKIKSKRERGDKKLFPSLDDEHILLTGVTLSDRRGSQRKSWEEDRGKQHSEKDKTHCFWDSVTTTMRQITPTRKVDKIEGWEPPRLSEGPDGGEEEEEEGGEGSKRERRKKDEPKNPSPLSSPLSISLPQSLSLPPWTGLGLEADSSCYSSLSESQAGGPVRWAARARGKLAAVRRRSPSSLSESTWEGLK